MPTYNARRLRERREQLGLSQVALAGALERTVSTYARYETGQVVPTAEMLGRMAAVLDVAVDDLYDRDDPADPVVRFARELHQMMSVLPPFTAEQKARLRVLLHGAA